MSNKNRNSNYDHLDRILREADIRDASTGRTWVYDPKHKDGGYWSDNAESVDRIRQQCDDIEKYLRS